MLLTPRLSPREPFIAALFVSGLGTVPYALGIRGKYKPTVESLGFQEAVILFVRIFVVLFVVFYFLKITGMDMGWFSGPDGKDKNKKPAKPTNEQEHGEDS